jgi:hypothetical protein
MEPVDNTGFIFELKLAKVNCRFSTEQKLAMAPGRARSSRGPIYHYTIPSAFCQAKNAYNNNKYFFPKRG